MNHRENVAPATMICVFICGTCAAHDDDDMVMMMRAVGRFVCAKNRFFVSECPFFTCMSVLSVVYYKRSHSLRARGLRIKVAGYRI